MQIKKGLCKIRKLYYTRLRGTCCGKYSVILCHMQVYSGMGTRCTVYASTIQWDTENQYIQGQNLRIKDQSYGPMVAQCMCKRTIL